MAVKLIALDIDGTLLDSRWTLPEANRAPSRKLRDGASRSRWLPAALRFRHAHCCAARLPAYHDREQWSMIRTQDGQTHLRHLLPRKTAMRVLEITRPWRDSTAVIFDRPPENVILEIFATDDPIRSAYYARNKEFIGQAVPLESCLTEDPLQVMLSGKVEAMRDAEAVLRGAATAEGFKVAATVYESRDFSMIDVLHPHCSKGAALAEWATLRGVTREEVMAVGDNHNDLEMLSYAGVPVVMAIALRS